MRQGGFVIVQAKAHFDDVWMRHDCLRQRQGFSVMQLKNPCRLRRCQLHDVGAGVDLPGPEKGLAFGIKPQCLLCQQYGAGLGECLGCLWNMNGAVGQCVVGRKQLAFFFGGGLMRGMVQECA